MSIEDDQDIDPSKPMSLQDAMLLGTRLHRLNLLDEAYGLYTAVLEVEPEHPDALQFLGILEHQRHHDQLALQYMQRAVAQVPDAPGIHHNLGNILLELRRFDEAADAYERCA
jgi:tetratricopeptide (TPR) repeat protein